MARHPDAAAPLAQGFAAAAGVDARVLVLGSLPGIKSIDAGEYYAHPRNVFWRIVDTLFDIPQSLPYAARVKRLNAAGVALWDVLQASRRKGSLDSAIDQASAVANDIPGFLATQPHIKLIAFNGKKAAEMYQRHVAKLIACDGVRQVTLPSTSPAHAAMHFNEKLRSWQQIALAAASIGDHDDAISNSDRKL